MKIKGFLSITLLLVILSCGSGKDRFISSKETFGEATPLSKLAHLKEEINELEDDLRNQRPGRRLEFADCSLLLYGIASSDGMDYEGIVSCINEKMSINRKRKWGKPNKDGVVNHIKEAKVL